MEILYALIMPGLLLFIAWLHTWGTKIEAREHHSKYQPRKMGKFTKKNESLEKQYVTYSQLAEMCK